MPCETIKVGGMVAIVRTSGRRRRAPSCKVCGDPAGYQCDYPSKKRKSGTCDAHLCAKHAYQVGPDLHYCPEHQAESNATPIQKGLV